MTQAPGNRLSKAKQIVIDSTGSSLKGEIGSKNRKDIYQFRQNSRSSFDLRLSQLRANASIALLNAQGKVIASSQRPGRSKEHINTILESGIYYVRVTSRGRRGTRYQLDLFSQPIVPALLRAGLSLSQGGTAVLSPTLLNTASTGQSTDEIVYTLTRLPRAGRLALKGKSLGVNEQFTQTDIDNGHLSYTNTVNVQQLNQRDVRDFKNTASTIAWEEFDGNDYEIYLYDDVTNTVTQLSNNQIDDKLEAASDGGIVWENVNENTRTLFFYDRSQGDIAQLTADDTSVSIADRITSTIELITDVGVVWRRGEFFGPQQLFFYNSVTNKTIQLAETGRFEAVVNNRIFWQKAPLSESSQLQFYDVIRNITIPISNVGGNSFGAVTDTYVIWEDGDFLASRARQIFLYDLKTGLNKPLTDRGNYSFALDGTAHAVWRRFDGNDNELILYDKATGSTTQITNNSLNDSPKGWLEGGLVWETFTIDFTNRSQLFFYNFSTSTSQPLTEFGINEFEGVSGSNAFWNSFDGTDTELFYYSDKTGKKLQLTKDEVYNPSTLTISKIANASAVWKEFDGNDNEIYFFDANRNSVQQLTDNQFDDTEPSIAGSSVIWQQFDGVDDEIFLYKPDSNITTQITQNSTNDFFEAFWNSKLFWRDKDGLYLGSFVKSDSFGFKVSDRSGELSVEDFNILLKA